MKKILATLALAAAALFPISAATPEPEPAEAAYNCTISVRQPTASLKCRSGGFYRIRVVCQNGSVRYGNLSHSFYGQWSSASCGSWWNPVVGWNQQTW